MSEQLLDCLGRRRSPAATSAFHTGRTPRNKGLSYPADPPPVEEIVAVMRAAGPGVYGDRLRAIIVVLWRAGLHVGEALALAESDLDPARGAVLVRRGKGGKRREVGLDAWGWRTYSDLRVMPASAEKSLQAPTFAVACVGIIAAALRRGPQRSVEWGRSTGGTRASSKRAAD
jgi:hypothetical protein